MEGVHAQVEPLVADPTHRRTALGERGVDRHFDEPIDEVGTDDLVVATRVSNGSDDLGVGESTAYRPEGRRVQHDVADPGIERNEDLSDARGSKVGEGSERAAVRNDQ